MARVSIEEKFILDAHSIARMADVSVHQVIGTMVLVWNTTQRRRALHITSREFEAVSGLEKDIAERLFDTLVHAGYFVPTKDPSFWYIKGNKKHIEKLDNWMSRSKNGGKQSVISRKNDARTLNDYNNIEAHASKKSEVTSNTTTITTTIPTSTSTSPTVSNSMTISKKEERESTEPSALVVSRPPLPKLADIWNLVVLKLSKVERSNSSRDRKAAARWKEMPDEDYWKNVITKIEASSFCCGKNDRGWRATFDWLIQPETHLKVSENKYESIEVRKSTHADVKQDAIRDQWERLNKGEL